MAALMSRLLPLACSLVVAGAVLAGTAMADEKLSSSRKDELTNLIRQDCGSCHGMTLKGGLGKPLLPRDLKEFTQSELAYLILEGVPDTPMPPWKELLSKAEADWIAMRLKKGLDK